MALITKYITLDEFKEYSGIDLIEELGDSDKAQAFLNRIETRMATFLDSRMYQNVDRIWPNFTDYQKLHYKLALIEQGIYIWRNGDVSVDNGYDPEQGLKIEEGTHTRLSIAPNAKEHLMLCGLWSYKLKPYGDTGNPFGWFF